MRARPFSRLPQSRNLLFTTQRDRRVETVELFTRQLLEVCFRLMEYDINDMYLYMYSAPPFTPTRKSRKQRREGLRAACKQMCHCRQWGVEFMCVVVCLICAID